MIACSKKTKLVLGLRHFDDAGKVLCRLLPLEFAHVAFDVIEQTVDEKDRNRALLHVAMTGFEAIDVIPTVDAKHVDHERRAEHEAHLVARHAGFELRQHGLIDEITLPHIDAVRREKRARGQ